MLAPSNPVRSLVAFGTVRPTLVLTPGIRLRADIGAALLELQQVSAEDRTALRTVRDDLRGALAHSAAIGETSVIASAAEAVRTAVGYLEASLPDQACAALTEALTRLAVTTVTVG
jgi:hypothetical protein